MLPQFDPTPYSSQIFWMTVSFVLLLVAFKKVFIPRIDAVLRKRNLTISEGESQISQIDQDIKNVESELESAKDSQIRETNEIFAAATKKSERLFDSQLEELRLENEERLNLERSRFYSEMKAMDSTFKMQIDITSQLLFEKLFPGAKNDD